jgi:hypothetical protein
MPSRKIKCCFLWCCYWGLALQQGFYTCQKWKDPHWQTFKNTLESTKIWSSYLIPRKHVSIHHHFSTFQPSHPMCQFKTINVLFWILKVKDNLWKFWTNGSCERLVMAMHDVVLSSNRNVVQGANLFSMTANEVTNIMDNQQWISVYVYVMKDYYQVSILLTLELGTCGSGCYYK